MRACSTLVVAGSAWRMAAASSSAAAALWTSIEERKLSISGVRTVRRRSRTLSSAGSKHARISQVMARSRARGAEQVVRPVEEYRARCAQHDVAGVEITVNQAMARRRSWWTHPVQAGVELGQHRPVPPCITGMFEEDGEHGWPWHPIHPEVWTGGRTHAGDGDAGGRRQPHHRRFRLSGDGRVVVAPENGAVVEVVHHAGSACGQHRRVRVHAADVIAAVVKPSVALCGETRGRRGLGVAVCGVVRKDAPTRRRGQQPPAPVSSARPRLRATQSRLSRGDRSA